MKWKCPKCHCPDFIDICVDLWVRLVQDPDNFETDADLAENHDHEWDRNHGAVCQNCNFAGNVSDFEVKE